MRHLILLLRTRLGKVKLTSCFTRLSQLGLHTTMYMHIVYIRKPHGMPNDEEAVKRLNPEAANVASQFIEFKDANLSVLQTENMLSSSSVTISQGFQEIILNENNNGVEWSGTELKTTD